MSTADNLITKNIREKIKLFNECSASDIELIALLIRTGDELKDVLKLSENLLRRYGTLADIAQTPIDQLTRENKGLNENKAAALKAALELGKRSACQAAPNKAIKCSQDMADIAAPMLKSMDRENFMVAVLNTKNMLISLETVSVGTLNSAVVHAREIFKTAIKKSAYGIILIHNHPSTDPSPSKEDFQMTADIKKAGKIIGIKVLDHIIIGGEDYFSFLDENIMPA